MALSRRRLVKDEPSSINEVNQSEDLMKEFEKKVDSLVPLSRRPIASLSENEQKTFNSVKNFITEHYHTDKYDNIYKTVLSKFPKSVIDTPDGPNVTGSTYLEYYPRTIGSYFTGCLVSTNIESATKGVNNGCSLMCAGSMPLPKSQTGWSFCFQNVIWCHLKLYDSPSIDTIGGEFQFIYLTKITSSDRAILFINYKSYSEFPGFTSEEKIILKRMKLQMVKLLSYDKVGTEYEDLIGEPKNIEDLKSRPSTIRAKPPTEVTDKWKNSADLKQAIQPYLQEQDPKSFIVEKVSFFMIILLFIVFLYCLYRAFNG